MLDFRDAPGLGMRGGHLARSRGTAAMRASKQLVDQGFEVGDPGSLARGMTISQRIGLSVYSVYVMRLWRAKKI